MIWRRGLLLLAVVGLVAGGVAYAKRKSLFASWLGSFGKMQIGETYLGLVPGDKPEFFDVSFQESRVEFGPLRLMRTDSAGLYAHRPIEVEHISAEIEPASLFDTTLRVRSVRARGVRLPWVPPERVRWSLPEYPVSMPSRSMSDARGWIEGMVDDSLRSIASESEANIASIDAMEDRYRVLRDRFEELRGSGVGGLGDRQFLQGMSREYHALNQKLAESRIQWREGSKDRQRRWSELQVQLMERLRTKVASEVPEIEVEVRAEAARYSERLQSVVLPFCDAISQWISQEGLSGGRDHHQRWKIGSGVYQGTLISMLDGVTETPFECSFTDRGDGGCRTIWRFEVPDAQGVLTVQAEWAGQGGREVGLETACWSMDCLWQRSAAAVFVSGRESEELEVRSGRTVRVQVTQEVGERHEVGERRIRVSAPWNRGGGIENRLVSTNRSEATNRLVSTNQLVSTGRSEADGGESQVPYGVLEFSSKGRVRGGLVQRDLLVATDSIDVEPRSLFEVENRLESRKRQWVRDEQSRLEYMLSEYLGMGTNREVNRWSAVSASQMERLRGIEQGLACWAESWDSAIALPQYRVGNRLVGHPDR